MNEFTLITSSRRTPTYVISNNGCNFVGADSDLQELIEAFDQDRITHETAQLHRISWKFNPTFAPHFGDVFEVLIKSAQKAIKAIIRDIDIYDEGLHTTIDCAERLLNSPHITDVSADPNDHSPLTPNHFLV